MNRSVRFLSGVTFDEHGSMAIETAIVVPILLLLSLGGFQVSTMVSRQSELQSATAEASAIALAAMPETQAERDTVEDVIEASTGLADDQVTLTPMFRCNADVAYVANAASCPADSRISSYLKLDLSDTYEPIWTTFGVGEEMDYNVTRYVMLAQES
jgi:Flp pilus assembly protein TadG